MSIFHSRPQTALLFVLFTLITGTSFAQKAGLEVTRCSAIDRTLTVKNVAVDATGRRFAANSKGIFQVKANDFATPVTTGAGERNVLSYPGGNTDFSWSEAKFKEQVNTPCSVTAAWYDSKTQTLWLGTDEAGLFQFSTQPELKMMQQYLPVNSKLKSPNITSIFQDASGRLWVGNEDGGVMYGTPGRWKNALNGFTVERTREFNTVIYVLAEGAISKAPGGEKWSDLALNEKNLEGDITDFDIDATGKMWLLSGVLTRFDLIAGTYDVFGGPEYYTSQYGTCLAVDQEGAVWVGTEDKGLFSVDKASNMVLNAFLESPISCEGNGRDAVLAAKVTGGTPPYVYAWNAGLTGENPRNIGAGTYAVTVTDSKGVTRTAEVPVPDSRLKLKVRQKKPASNGTAADGSAEVDIATNASGIVVTWDNGENRVVATQLVAGEHRVTVSDPKGCTMTLTVTITEAGQPLKVVTSAESAIPCAGQSGMIAAKPTGGKPPYKYAWSNPAFTGDKPTAAAGTYTVTVTDANGSSATATMVFSQPDALSLNAIAQGFATAGGADGKALAQARGGSGVYTFKWDNGETTFNATKLTDGNHSVTATDANGCVATATVKIESKVDAFAVVLREVRPAKCHGEKAGLTVAAVGGRPPYKEYKWSPEIKSIAEGVGAGVYTVTATDASGATATATINIKEPKKLSVSTLLQAGTSPGKNDGKALAIVEGGTGTMFFTWDNAEVTAATNQLSPGLHYVTVTDENGCSTTGSINIPEGALPVSIAVKETSNIKCAGEKANLEVQVTGGKGPFKYVWSNPALVGGRPGVSAGDYTVTLTDAAGTTATAAVSVKQPEALSVTTQALNPAGAGATDGKASAKVSGGTSPYTYKWSNGETTAEAAKLPAGNHTVSVTDANGCSASASVAIGENVLPLAASVNSSIKAKCAGEKTTLAVEVSGGKKPYKYAWNDPAVEAGKPLTLTSGNYTVTVTDATGAITTASINITQPETLAATAQAQSPASIGGSDGKASVKITGGTGAYNYRWSNGETTAEAVKLAAGNHSVSVTDANGCTASAGVVIGENVLPLAVNINASVKAKCAGEKTTLAVDVSGGKKPYKYAWSNPAVEAGKPVALASGDYTVTVTDAVGTTTTASINLTQPEPLTATAQAQSPASVGGSDGKASVKTTGGTSPFNYRWSNGETTLEAVKLPAGNHSVSVTDANGCAANASIAISENILPLSAAISEETKVKCAGDQISLGVSVTGGKKPYKYAWNNPSVEAGKPASLVNGTYIVTVTDAVGSSTTASLNLKQPELLTVAVDVQAPASTGNADGKALAKPNGGTAPYIFAWSSGESSNTAERLAPGPQSVKVTDANGCTATGTMEITENILTLTVALTEKTPIKCAGEKATLNLKVSGGKAPFNYAWNNPALSGEAPSGLDAGDYAVTVTDAKGNTKTAALSVKAPTALNVELIRNIGATTDRSSDGKAELTVKGGTPKYSIVWDTKQTGLVAPKLALGKHSVTVTDANGCNQTIDFETEKRVLPELTGSLQSGQTIRMRLLNFDTDSSTIKPESLPMLDELFDFMSENGAVVIEIAGHTNNLPTDAFADQLSTARAKAVADYLTAKGIDPKRLVFKGYGKRLPLVPNTSAEGRKTNQRVEIKILKLKE